MFLSRRVLKWSGICKVVGEGRVQVLQPVLGLKNENKKCRFLFFFVQKPRKHNTKTQRHAKAKRKSLFSRQSYTKSWAGNAGSCKLKTLQRKVTDEMQCTSRWFALCHMLEGCDTAGVGPAVGGRNDTTLDGTHVFTQRTRSICVQHQQSGDSIQLLHETLVQLA